MHIFSQLELWIETQSSLCLFHAFEEKKVLTGRWTAIELVDWLQVVATPTPNNICRDNIQKHCETQNVSRAWDFDLYEDTIDATGRWNPAYTPRVTYSLYCLQATRAFLRFHRVVVTLLATPSFGSDRAIFLTHAVATALASERRPALRYYEDPKEILATRRASLAENRTSAAQLVGATPCSLYGVVLSWTGF